jgi:hypothetical protein
MKKNDVFTFTAPNGVEVTAVVINELSYRVIAGDATTTWLCYAQNRLFTYKMMQNLIKEFADKNGSIICREIKGVDTGKVMRSCDGCIEDAVAILDKYLLGVE